MNASLHALSNGPLAERGAAPNLRLRVGEHVVDLGALRVVTNPGAPRLSSKAAGVLVELARRAGDTVPRDTLLDRVWRDRVTTPDVLTQAIKELRRAFVDDSKPPRYIETVPKVGYRLLVPVAEIDPHVLPVGDEAVSVPANDDPAGTRSRNVEPSADATGRTWALWLAGTAVVVACVLLLARSLWLPGVHGMTWTAADRRALTSDPGAERRPRVSPDGTRFVYSKLDPDSGFERVIVRGVEPTQSMFLTRRAVAHEEMPMWSPDGTRIAFERVDQQERCTLFIVPSLGGAEDEVGACGDYRLSYYDWTPDGRGLVMSDQSAAAGGGLPLGLLDLASGERRPLQYQRTASDVDLDPHFSPDGRWIVFRRGLSPHSDLFLVAAGGGDVRRLTHLDARIGGHAWTPDGDAVVFASNADGTLGLYTVDVRDARVQSLHVAPAAFPSMARSGNRVLYEIQRTQTVLAAAALPDVAAEAHPASLQLLARSTGSDTAPVVSPDGRQAAFVSDRSGAQEIWVYGLDAAAEPRVLTDYRAALIAGLAWSSDGTHLLASVREQGRTQLIAIDVASRRAKAVAVSQQGLLAGSYGPRPDSYLVLRRSPDARRELVLIERADSGQEHVVPIVGAVEHAELDRAAGLVYYTRTDEPGLFRRALAGGAEQPVTRKVTASILDGWRIVDGRVWYVSGMMQKPFELRELDPATGMERVRLRVDAWLRDVNFDVSPQRDRVLFAPMGPEDIDVGAFALQAS